MATHAGLTSTINSDLQGIVVFDYVLIFPFNLLDDFRDKK